MPSLLTLISWNTKYTPGSFSRLKRRFPDATVDPVRLRLAIKLELASDITDIAGSTVLGISVVVWGAIAGFATSVQGVVRSAE